jgi:hypothetical protein
MFSLFEVFCVFFINFCTLNSKIIPRFFRHVQFFLTKLSFDFLERDQRRFKNSLGPRSTWKSGPFSCHFHFIMWKFHIRHIISFKILLQCIMMDIFWNTNVINLLTITNVVSDCKTSYNHVDCYCHLDYQDLLALQKLRIWNNNNNNNKNCSYEKNSRNTVYKFNLRNWVNLL